MPSIRTLFHPDLPIDRPIEKVITFANRQPKVLESEAREYVVTKNLASEYSKLLNYFDDGQKGDRGGAECCVWLSGFYGSGKSSFAKYFGLTFDPRAEIESGHFAESFIKQFPDSTQQTRFKTVRKNFDVAVFLLDLAAMGTAGSIHTPISTQLFDQVCSWAGFASDAKIAQLEAKLTLDNRLEEFRQKASDSTGMEYAELRNLSALLIPTASRLAHEFYPNIWPAEDSLQSSHTISTQTEQERVEQMLDLIEEKTGTKRVLFIVDEVGHFLRNNESLINNLDGLAKNLKQIGEGKAWLIATAQETLPNTGPLFGLRDRFPIKIDLKPSDIREITHRRLLKKSVEGAATLKAHFGQKLIHLTALEKYQTEKPLDEESFVDFYPLLPQLFDILIDSIRSLARLQGGIGLRSAIRCVQDLLIGGNPNAPTNVDRPVPALMTVADLYDVLQPDIAPVNKDAVLGVDRIALSYGESSWEHKVAKAIALLQQIDGFPITRKNLAALLYPEVGADSIADQVDDAVAALLAAPTIPIGEDAEGVIGFQSETVSKIDKDREGLVVTNTHRLAIQSRLLRELFQKTPRVTIENTKTVEAGISILDGGREQKITDRDTDIRFVIQFVSEMNLEEAKKNLINESLADANKSRIFVAVPRPAEIDALLSEVHRANEITKLHQNDPNPEVQRYVASQEQLVVTKSAQVQNFLTTAIQQSWLIFKGNPSAASTLGSDYNASLRAKLTEAAEEVFNKYKCAPENVSGSVAENFLRVKDLSQVTKERDPLGLVKIQGIETNINLSHPALAALLDFFERHPNPGGKRLLEEFTRPPFGWSKDTTRYLAAALFYAQRIKIRTNSQDVKVVGDLAFAAFKSNTSFNGTTILPNVSEIPVEVRQRAAKNLTELTGENVIPLPQKIAEVAVNHIPKFVKEFTNLPTRVSGLGLPADRFKNLQNGLADALVGDGSDAPTIFGGEDSELFNDIVWARKIAGALDLGAEKTLRKITDLIEESKHLAAIGVMTDLPGELEEAGAETLATVNDGTFYKDIQALGHCLDKLQEHIDVRCAEEVASLNEGFTAQVESLKQSSDYKSLPTVERQSIDESLSGLVFDCEPTIAGLLTANANINRLTLKLQSIRNSILEHLMTTHRVKETSPEIGPSGTKKVSIKKSIATVDELNSLIATLKAQEDSLPIHLQVD